MTLSELFGRIAQLPDGMGDIVVTGVTSDSREVEQGFVFVCIRGASFDGHSVAAKMLEKGAAAVVTQERLGVDREITLSDTRRAYPELLSAFYGRPTERIRLGAVTGTNGKTTIANLCTGIVRSLGRQVGVIGTLGVDTGKGLEYTHGGPPTTPEPRRLYSLFADMTEMGTDHCFIEASSQALAQHRFAAERFCVAAFTNLTQDHLDYHKTMENYFIAKRGLFDMCENAVINIDDEYGRRIADYCREKGINCITTSVEGVADFYTEQVKLSPDGAEFLLTDSAAGKTYPVKISMTGLYNVSNAIQAAVMCSCMGYPLWQCLQALETIKGVGGRLETLYSGDYTIIRDYAHTPDGLEKLLSALKPTVSGRLIVLFGAAGERDTAKRPMMAEVCARYGDYLVVSSDNPAHEDPQAIIDSVKKGIPDGVPFAEYPDRAEAVRYACAMLQKGDLLALCGKGHEDYQIIGDEYVHLDEKELVTEYLKEKGTI